MSTSTTPRKPLNKEALRRALRNWYRASHRHLPWRGTNDPYEIWVSEIMLQQTTVKTVLPRYRPFLERFPTASALARAKEREVLKAWAGLGYYGRARRLRAAARVLAKSGGTFPRDFEEASALPGIGRSTAGAVLSIAYGLAHPVLDGNVARVISRIFALKPAPPERELWGIARGILDARDPGDWNQAMMELGAVICLPRSPRCPECPLRELCQARALGIQESLPEKKAGGRLFQDVSMRSLYIEKGGHVLLWKRSKDERLLKGHWSLPEERHLKARTLELMARASHSITHHRIRLELRRAELGTRRLPPQALWVRKDRLSDYLVSSLWLKALSATTAS